MKDAKFGIKYFNLYASSVRKLWKIIVCSGITTDLVNSEPSLKTIDTHYGCTISTNSPDLCCLPQNYGVNVAGTWQQNKKYVSVVKEAKLEQGEHTAVQSRNDDNELDKQEAHVIHFMFHSDAMVTVL
jgi:hypothetical protein